MLTPYLMIEICVHFCNLFWKITKKNLLYFIQNMHSHGCCKPDDILSIGRFADEGSDL